MAKDDFPEIAWQQFYRENPFPAWRQPPSLPGDLFPPEDLEVTIGGRVLPPLGSPPINETPWNQAAVDLIECALVVSEDRGM